MQTGSGPDGRQDRGGHREGPESAPRAKGGGGGEGGSSPSINLQAGAGVAHARERSKACAGACAGAGCAWGDRGAESRECPPAPAPWRLALRASARKGVPDGDRGPAGPTGHRGWEAIAPWSLPWKTGEARSVRPSSWPMRPAPPRCTPRPQKKPGLPAFLERAGRQVPPTPVLPGPRPASHAELDGRAGASHGGGGEGRAGRTAGGGAGGGRGRARTRGAARGGHRFWQHCSLVGFCPSVVGGTLMSTTLLPGDSSWAARSAICFCDTMR